ncbi:tetratricopeptide TPR_2 [Candidatus Moduliflexus flocculans]|uniref:Tetratricopeptide TPR_2 n=1 Tax=Candidatus Moduliflexus flocculans TaxID=1499966 RepID=A0A0S6VYP6_9BACT|nr:tetratricopeptide TPR_2 [Candidatus Moduliflexus flocculans]
MRTGQFRKIVGKTRCHNQISIQVPTRDLLLEIINVLSEILLEPFLKKPSKDEYNKIVGLELTKVRELADRGVNISLDLNPVRSFEDYSCLIGPTKIHPDAWILNSLGMARVEIGDFEYASNIFKEALNLSPSYFDAVYNTAVCLANMGHYEEAVAYYERTLELNPDDRDTQIELLQARQKIPGRFTQEGFVGAARVKEQPVIESKVSQLHSSNNGSLKNIAIVLNIGFIVFFIYYLVKNGWDTGIFTLFIFSTLGLVANLVNKGRLTYRRESCKPALHDTIFITHVTQPIRDE